MSTTPEQRPWRRGQRSYRTPRPTARPRRGGVEPPRQRWWVRWVGLAVFVVVLGTVCVLMGRWQIDRLHQRELRNAHVLEVSAVDHRFDDVFAGPVTDWQAYSRTSVTGTFDPDHQFVIRYRQNGDAFGAEFLTPLRLGDGRTVLVDRGFTAVESGQPMPTVAPAPPTGQVTVTGWARRDERGPAGAVVPHDGTARLVNSGEIGATLPYPIVNGWLAAQTITGPDQRPVDSDLAVVGLPDLNEGPHFWYAVQWFAFAAFALVGLGVFVRGDLRERRAARADAPADTDTDSTTAPVTDHPDTRIDA